MCDCLEKSSKEIFEFLKKELIEKGKKVAEWNEEDSGYVNRLLSFGNKGKGGGWKLVMPYELKYTPIKANGTNGREVAHKTSVFPTYCPFCGKKQSN